MASTSVRDLCTKVVMETRMSLIIVAFAVNIPSSNRGLNQDCQKKKVVSRSCQLLVAHAALAIAVRMLCIPLKALMPLQIKDVTFG